MSHFSDGCKVTFRVLQAPVSGKGLRVLRMRLCAKCVRPMFVTDAVTTLVCALPLWHAGSSRGAVAVEVANLLLNPGRHLGTCLMCWLNHIVSQIIM
jgi:hypothetical protein